MSTSTKTAKKIDLRALSAAIVAKEIDSTPGAKIHMQRLLQIVRPKSNKSSAFVGITYSDLAGRAGVKAETIEAGGGRKMYFIEVKDAQQVVMFMLEHLHSHHIGKLKQEVVDLADTYLPTESAQCLVEDSTPDQSESPGMARLREIVAEVVRAELAPLTKEVQFLSRHVHLLIEHQSLSNKMLGTVSEDTRAIADFVTRPTATDVQVPPANDAQAQKAA